MTVTTLKELLYLANIYQNYDNKNRKLHFFRLTM